MLYILKILLQGPQKFFGGPHAGRSLATSVIYDDCGSIGVIFQVIGIY